MDPVAPSPGISVILPVRNVEPYIGAAVESILEQTYRDFELIAVDDGSTDRTPDLLEEYAARDCRVRVIRSCHLGSAAAANLALQHSSRRWVAMMHGDDVALPQRLQRLHEMSETDPDVVIWGTDGFHINSTGEILSSFRVGPTSKEACRKMRRNGHIVQSIHPTVLLRREVALLAGGYDQTHVPAEDIDLFDRMLLHGDLVTIPEPLMKYRIHGGALSQTKATRMALMRRFIETRQRHRLATGQEMTLDQFLPLDRNRPFHARVRDWMWMTGDNYYRTGGMHYGERRLPMAVAFLAISICLRPIGSIKRLWWQVFSARARRHIRAYRAGHLPQGQGR